MGVTASEHHWEIPLDKIKYLSSKGSSPTTLNENRAAAAQLCGLEHMSFGDMEQAPPFSSLSIPSPWSSGWQALSIFSGCGGLDLGFLQEGVFSRWAYDVDRRALGTYVANLPGIAVQADLSRVTPVESRGRILLAGAPCQGFSTVGKRQIEDPRNALLMRVADVAFESKCQVVVVENVPAAVSGLHRRLWEALEDRLRFGGYNVRRVFLEGLSCGLGQRRKRLFLVCWRGSDCINLEISKRSSLTVRQALQGMNCDADDDVEWPKRGSRHWQIARHIHPGHKLSNVRLSSRSVASWDIPSVFGATSKGERELLVSVAKLRRRNRVRPNGDGDPVSISRLTIELGRAVKKQVKRLIKCGYLRSVGTDCVELRQTYNGRFRRLDWDAPSPTVDTKFGRIDLFLHPEENRSMTPREAARIQGFPDTFSFVGTRSDKFRQIGNAVPPPMASVLAEYIREAILKA